MALVKLEITGYESKDYSGPKVGTYTVLMNPESYRMTGSVDFSTEQSPGSAAPELRFNAIPAASVGFKLVFDGTNLVASAPKELQGVGVADQIAKFQAVAFKFNGKIHRTNFVRLSWGSMSFEGVLTEMNVSYTLFDPNGNPLRAEAEVTFKSTVSLAEAALKAGKKSPDMTQVRRIEASDTLPSLCVAHYGSIDPFVQVATANGLDRLRGLKVGSMLTLPPMKSR